MASNDITFGIGLELNENDLKKTVRSMQDVANQIEKIFEHTASAMTQRLANKGATTSLGMAGIEPAVERNFRVLENRVSSLFPKMKNPRKRLEDLYKKEGRPNTLHKLETLERVAQGLAPYDMVYAGINTLRDKAAADSIDPAEGQGIYGVLQRYINRCRGHLYNANLSVPDVITRKVLEAGEYYRDINLKSGSMFRSALRYVQDKKYSANSLSRAGDYLWYAGGGDLQLLSDIYGLNIGTEASKAPSRVSAKSKAALEAWIGAGLGAQTHKEALLGGGLTQDEYDYHFSGYKDDFKQFIGIFKKLFPEEKAIAENLKKLNKSDLVRFGAGGGRGPSSAEGIWTAIGAKAAKDLFHTGADMLESYWGESITRNAYASRQAYLSRWTKGGKVAGSIIGGILGGLVGGPVGAGIGYSTLGEVGQLFGKYSETMYKADIKSSSDMMARIRNKALWGNEYNTYFAKALTDIGIANGESAMGGLADRSMSMRARMMLGQVGEQEMLYMSMMPNYYAALMAGVTGPSLLNTYKRDLDAIGDPSMKYLVGQSIGNTEAFAAANNQYFGTMYPSLVRQTTTAESALTRVQHGFVSGRWGSAMETLNKDVSEIFASVRRGDPTVYRSGRDNGAAYQLIQDTAKMLNFRVNVFVNGEEIQRNTSNDQVFLNDLQLYTVGG